MIHVNPWGGSHGFFSHTLLQLSLRVVRGHFFFNGITCLRERFSALFSTLLLRNLSQRAVLEATFSISIAEFVAESGSRSHIFRFYRRICRREPISKPHFTFLSQNLSQRAVLEATFSYFIGKFVAESRSRNHISLFYC